MQRDNAWIKKPTVEVRTSQGEGVLGAVSLKALLRQAMLEKPHESHLHGEYRSTRHALQLNAVVAETKGLGRWRGWRVVGAKEREPLAEA